MSALLGSEIEKKFEKLIKGEDGIYHIDSHLHLKTKKIKIIAPERIDLYKGHYLKGRTTQIMFGVSDNNPAVCSLLRRDDLVENLVELADSEWLNPRESLNVFSRHFGKAYPINLTDCHPTRGNYPFP